MKSIFYFFIITLVLLSFTACGDEPARETTTQLEKAPEAPKITIADQSELESILTGIGIPVYAGAEFISIEQSSPTQYSGKYKAPGKNYAQTEKEFIDFYNKIIEEKLKPAGWKNTSLPGTAILNLHNKGGEIKSMSIMITPSDYVEMKGGQEITYTVNIRN